MFQERFHAVAIHRFMFHSRLVGYLSQFSRPKHISKKPKAEAHTQKTFSKNASTLFHSLAEDWLCMTVLVGGPKQLYSASWQGLALSSLCLHLSSLIVTSSLVLLEIAAPKLGTLLFHL